MLKKMLLQGLAAAVMVGGAAAVYAQAQDNGYLSAPAQAKAQDGPAAKEIRKGEHGQKGNEHDQGRLGGREHSGDDD